MFVWAADIYSLTVFLQAQEGSNLYSRSYDFMTFTEIMYFCTKNGTTSSKKRWSYMTVWKSEFLCTAHLPLSISFGNINNQKEDH